MLLELAVENFALIERVRLRLGPGLNIFTGETGAGKSILIDAVELALGGRASVDQIRTGAETSLIEAAFDISNWEGALEKLGALGLEGNEDGLLVLSREISRTGRNTVRINNRLATVSALRELGAGLVELHGQHEHQVLLRPGGHIQFLDHYAGESHCSLRENVARLYARLREVTGELAGLGSAERERAQRIDLLRFQINEIDRAGLKGGEEEELSERRRVLANSSRLKEIALLARARLAEGTAGESALVDALSEVITLMEDGAGIDPRLGGLLEGLRTSFWNLEETARDLRLYAEKVDFDPSKLAAVESRLDLIRNLKRKYGDSISAVLKYRDEAARELASLEAAETRLEGLADLKADLSEQLAEASEELSRRRACVAAELAERVTGELAFLGMKDSRFEVRLSRRPPGDGFRIRVGDEEVGIDASGIDQAEFMLAPNPGEPLLPLAKIASGGELARAMLALRSLLAGADRVPVLIFDEIDAGIGGRAAAAVARKMAILGRFHQVLCVTHLPLIASVADRHYRIAKETRDGRTVTNVEYLAEDQRPAEITRMLGAVRPEGVTLDHALELLEEGRRTREAAG